MNQTHFFKENPKLEHARSGARGNARSKRPFRNKKWMHLCLKASKAKGQLCLLKEHHQRFILSLLRKTKQKYFLEIKHFANAGDHLHLQVKARRREDLQNFLRVFTTQIARHVTGARKGKPFGRFWDSLTYSRVLITSLEALYLNGYIKANIIQAKYGYKARQESLAKFRKWVASLRKRPRSQVGPSLQLVLQPTESIPT